MGVTNNMGAIYADLAARIISLANLRYPNRVLVGIAGPPGSGKSTVADSVVALINATPPDIHELLAVGVSLDGFHYTRDQLDEFADPAEAHKRRGAPWTFDIGAVTRFIGTLQASKLPRGERQEIFAPSFDHALKDPVEKGILIPAKADVVILDGNYLLLNDEGWHDLGTALDFRIFIEVDPKVARARVAKRHVLAGIEPSLELGEKRFDGNDGPNGELIRSRLRECDLVVESTAI